jgi:hypothetical protein
LRNATEQLKQFFQKVPQTKPQAFSLAAGLPGKVESKTHFSGFRAAVSSYMQEFLAHTPSQPMQPFGSLYPVRRVEPIFKILPPQPASNPPSAAQPRFRIVNSSLQHPVASLPSQDMSSEDSSTYDCRFFHTAKGCKFGTREFPELCKDSLEENSILVTSREMVEPPLKDGGWPNSRSMAEHPERAAFQQEGQIAEDGRKEICYYYRDNGRYRRGKTCRFEHVDRSQQWLEEERPSQTGFQPSTSTIFSSSYLPSHINVSLSSQPSHPGPATLIDGLIIPDSKFLRLAPSNTRSSFVSSSTGVVSSAILSSAEIFTPAVISPSTNVSSNSIKHGPTMDIYYYFLDFSIKKTWTGRATITVKLMAYPQAAFGWQHAQLRPIILR